MRDDYERETLKALNKLRKQKQVSYIGGRWHLGDIEKTKATPTKLALDLVSDMQAYYHTHNKWPKPEDITERTIEEWIFSIDKQVVKHYYNKPYLHYYSQSVLKCKAPGPKTHIAIAIEKQLKRASKQGFVKQNSDGSWSPNCNF